MPKIEPFQKYTDEYENWFEVNKFAFQSELNAIKTLLQQTEGVIEIGIGSGLFAKPLGIIEGIDPSESMRNRAQQKGLRVLNGVAEQLPYANNSLNGAVMITTICFVDNIYQSFKEVFRVLKNGGFLILGFVDKNSLIGKEYFKHKNESLFYKDATFFGTKELYEILNQTGFKVTDTCQTIFGALKDIHEVQPVKNGFGEGSFVVIKAIKKYGNSI